MLTASFKPPIVGASTVNQLMLLTTVQPRKPVLLRAGFGAIV